MSDLLVEDVESALACPLFTSIGSLCGICNDKALEAARAWVDQQKKTPNYQAATDVLNHHLDKLQVFSNLDTDHQLRFGIDAVQKIVDAAL